MEYEVKDVKVTKLERKEGTFTNESGKELSYSNVWIEFTIGDYPLIFRAKLDKNLKDYVDVAYD